ncbi:MAG TPA: hypothetical protein VJY54_00315 [Lachnospiraceae bacterium]|nr:hypothetical protein [Lachnospiraceae bacterium]
MKFSEIIFIIDCLLALFIYLILYNVCGKRKLALNASFKNTKFLREAYMEKKCNIYIKSAITWDFVYHWITLSSMIATIVVIYLLTFFTSGDAGSTAVDTGRVFLYSSVSLFLTLAVYVLEPKKKAVAYRTAFQVLVNALDKHQITDCDENDKSSDDWIAESLEKAEKILSEAHK